MIDSQRSCVRHARMVVLFETAEQFQLHSSIGDHETRELIKYFIFYILLELKQERIFSKFYDLGYAISNAEKQFHRLPKSIFGNKTWSKKALFDCIESKI